MAINTPHVSTSAPWWALASTFAQDDDGPEDDDDLNSADSSEVNVHKNLSLGPICQTSLSIQPTYGIVDEPACL